MTETNLILKPTDHVMAIKDVKRQVTAMHELFRDVMKVGDHYGVIPGTDKPTLYKAGAEKVCLLLRLSPTFERTLTQDGDHLTVLSECTLTHGPSGMVVSTAGSICSTKETKWGSRQATRKCPKCGKAAIHKSKPEYGGGWYCFTKKGGCNAKFDADDKTITSQSGEREDNPNLADTYNTVLKMADKRAYVAATLFGTAASDIYTQDMEDFVDTKPIPQQERHQYDPQPTYDRAPPPDEFPPEPEKVSDPLPSGRSGGPVAGGESIVDWFIRNGKEHVASGDFDPWWEANKAQIQKKCIGKQWSGAILKFKKGFESKQAESPHLSLDGVALMAELEECFAEHGSPAKFWDQKRVAVLALPKPEQNIIEVRVDQMDNQEGA